MGPLANVEAAGAAAPPPPPRLRSGVAWLVAALAVGLLLLLYHLGAYGLWDPDEGRHAEIARELLGGTGLRRWALLTFNGSPYHDKPVLYYWLTSLAYELLGVTPLAARLVSASAGAGVLAATLWWARRQWGVATAVAATLVLATSLEFVALGRYGDLNMLLTFWLTAGVLAAHAWAERGGRGWGLGLAAAAAAGGTLTKGFVAPVLIGGTFVGYLALRGQLGLLRLRPLLRAGALYLCVTLPWFVVAGVADPAYLRDFIVEHHIQRFLGGSRHLHPKPLLFTPLMTLVAFLPWSPLLPAVVRRGVVRWRARSAAADLCLAWAGGIVLFFTCSRGKLGTYVLPAMPPLALVTGRLLATLREGPSDAAERRWVDWALVVAGVLFAAAAPAIVWVAAREHGGAFVPFAWGAVALVPLGVLVAGLAWRARPRTAAAVVALGTAVTVLGFYGAVAPALSDVVGDAVLARAIRMADPTGQTPVIAYRTQNASLLFHLERPVPRLDAKRRLRKRLAEAPKTFVVTRSVHLEGLPPDFTLLAGGTGGGHAVYVYERPG